MSNDLLNSTEFLNSTGFLEFSNLTLIEIAPPPFYSWKICFSVGCINFMLAIGLILIVGFLIGWFLRGLRNSKLKRGGA